MFQHVRRHSELEIYSPGIECGGKRSPAPAAATG